MKLRYKVSEENYIEMLQKQLKRRDRSPISLLITFVCTIGQMGMLIYLIATGGVTGKNVYILGAMSALIFILNIIYRVTTHRRASVTLQRFKLQGKISEDFWKDHEFRLDSDSLTVRFGSLRSVYSLQEINGYEELDSSLLIYCKGTVADIVPYTAIEDKEAFLEAIREAQHTQIVDNAERLRDDVPASFKYHFNYSYTLDSYLAHQREAYRRLYTTKLILNWHTIIRLFVSLYALGYIFINPKPWVVALCIAVFIIFNLQHIVTFTPLCNLTIKSGLGDTLAHKPDPETDAYITADSIIIRGSMHSLDIPVKEVKAMRRIKGGVALYLPKNVMLTIPEPEHDENGDFEKFIKFMDYKAN
ncbi:MAG: hypothetical protein ACOX81_05120 [Candidatus Heteroscillospira sp.]|jgi:hypothetical protein